MLELLLVFGALALGAAIFIGMLKLLVALVLLPSRSLFWLPRVSLDWCSSCPCL